MGPRPFTMHQAVYNLHTLLQKAGVSLPYIMVGASHGSLLVRLFAQQYPNEVVGMVLVDAGYENGIHYINGKKLRPATEATGKAIPAVKTMATAADNQLARIPQAVKAIGEALNKMGFPCTKVEPPVDRLPDSIQKLRLWALSQITRAAVVVGELAPEVEGGIVDPFTKRIHHTYCSIRGDEVLQTENGRLPTVGTLNVSHKERSRRAKLPLLGTLTPTE